MTKVFSKSFTQQDPIPAGAIAAAVDVLNTGRLHRYNVSPGEAGQVAELEREYANWQGAAYCIAVTSGGQALQMAMRASGVTPGDKVLSNAYTLAPVPGAIHSVGGAVVLVEIDENWHIDMDDLARKAEQSGARYLVLSHMRGHIADMDAVQEICAREGITLIEDCAHTMGARWNGIRSGNFGSVACFSTQTYKHINSGEGGFLTTDDAEIAARATILSGSYMLYSGHGAGPDEEVFQRVRLDTPNCSARLDNLRASILRPQLHGLEDNVARWNRRWQILAEGFRAMEGVHVPERVQHEEYVGSSFQFRALGVADVPQLVEGCLQRGVEIKWFGADEPVGFTSRFDSWRYLGAVPELPQTRRVLSKTCDLRVPLTFSEEDCRDIVEIVSEEVAKLVA